MKYIVIIIVVFLFLTSCEKQITWDLTNKSQDLIVVDGMITDELKNQYVKLSKPVGNLNDAAAAISGAQVTLSNGDSTVSLIENPAGSGIYMTLHNYAGVAGASYLLDITYNGKKYSAAASMERNTNFKILRYSKATNSDLYKIDWVVNSYNANEYSMFEIKLDWSMARGYQNLPPSECKATVYYYSLPTIDVNEIFSPEIEKITFPLGTVITEKRYVITRAHAAYLRAMLSETNWSGGYFDSAPANVPTNLSEGAVGFFSACPVMSVSMVVIAQ